jgi:hypothetical protein
MARPKCLNSSPTGGTRKALFSMNVLSTRHVHGFECNLSFDYIVEGEVMDSQKSALSSGLLYSIGLEQHYTKTARHGHYLTGFGSQRLE